MGASQENNNYALLAFPTSKITVMEETLTQAVANFRDLVLEFEQLHLENISFKKLVLKQKEKLECQTCTHCEELKQVVADKEEIINSISSVLNKLNQTKDFHLVDVILKKIYGETDILTPPKSVSPQKENIPNVTIKENVNEKKVESTFKSPKKGLDDQICKDESVSEIDGTPTGRKSPIFQNRKTKTNLSLKDKKKCPDSWPSPENKTIKLTLPTPARSRAGGRLRQGRLSFVKMKSCNVIDLTCSPEASGGAARGEINVQCNVKKEVIDNDETILPSPTSGPVKLPLYKSKAKDSPSKFKKPPVTLEFKIEDDTSDHNIEKKLVNNENGKNIEHSINLLNPFSNRFKSKMKQAKLDDETHCGDESISLLQHNVKKVDSRHNQQINSPIKRPLAENVNITNMQNHVNEARMSILHREPGAGVAVKANDDVVKRAKTNMAPVYKEPTVRKKAEKRALPGWSCDECRNFYDEMYKDDPEMLAQKMEECSKHRGRTNPARPKTPDGFWYPRWDVPQDTEEFNRRNNAN